MAIVDVDGKALDKAEIKLASDKGLIEIFDPGARLSPGKLLDKIKSMQAAPQQEPKGWQGLADALDEIHANADQFCCVALDTLTMAENHIKRYIAFTNRKAKFEYAEWGVLLMSYQELFSYFYSIPVPLKIINMHLQYDKDEFTGRVKLLPLITGSFKDKAGADVSEFYHCTIKENGPNKLPSYTWRVAPTSQFVARSDVFKGQVEVAQSWEPVWKTLL